MTWRYFTTKDNPGEVLRRIDTDTVMGESYIWKEKRWDSNIGDFIEIAFPGLSSDVEWTEISEEEAMRLCQQ